MKICPFCSAENRDEAAVCFYCGRNLNAAVPPQNTPGRTQPVHLQPRGSTPPPPASPPPSSTQPYSTQPMPPQGGTTPQGGASPQPGYPQPGYQPPSGYSQPPSGYPQPSYPAYPQDAQTGYTQPGYPPAQGYPQGYPAGYQPNYNYPAGSQAAYPPGSPPPGYPYPQGTFPPQGVFPPQAAFPPPPPEPVVDAGPSRAWRVLALSLGALLLCVCAFAAYTFTAATTGRANLLGAQFSTQVAQVITGPTATAPLLEPTEMPSPTPWPTFTPIPPTEAPQPTNPPSGESTPNPPAVNVEKLLSPECAAALDHLNQLNEQFKKEPTAPLNQDWRSQFSQATADLKTYCGTLDSASPVPGMLKETQQKLSQASSEFDQATQLFNEGVSQLNPAKFLEAAQHAGAAGQALNDAMAELKKIGQ